MIAPICAINNVQGTCKAKTLTNHIDSQCPIKHAPMWRIAWGNLSIFATTRPTTSPAVALQFKIKVLPTHPSCEIEKTTQ